MSFIQIKNISQSFGKKVKTQVLKNVSFEIPANTSLAILGKSGSGKSTLLNIMSGLIRPDEGEVLYDGKNLFNGKKDPYKFRNQKIGLVFQSFHLQPNNTVFENVFLPLEIAGKTGKEAKEKVKSILEMVGLEDKLKEKAVNLSGGQKQRVAIARSLVNDPEIIFADEPTGNLDPRTSEITLNLILNLAKKYKVAIIFVTHNYNFIKKFDKCFGIEEGKLKSINNV